MVTLAGGMESEFSDSDLEIGFNFETPSLKNTNNLIAENLNFQNHADSSSKRNVNQENGDIPQKMEKKDFRNKLDKMHKNTRNKYGSNRRQCLNFKSSELYDDLRYAIMQGNLEVTKNILSKDIFVDVILKSDWTGLMHACSSAHSEIVSFLLERKADPNYHRDMFTPLMAVCASRKNEDELLKCCKLLLKHGAKVNARERHYTTPLMFAAREGYVKIVEELINNGADVNMQDNRGNTALALAAICGHGLIVRILMEKGSDINIKNNMGQTAIDLAYDNGHTEIVSLLDMKHLLPEKRPEKSLATLGKNNELEVIYSTRGQGSSDKSKSFKKIGELEMFLAGIECQDLMPLFTEHELNFHDLLIMCDEDLEKIGINKVGARKRILEACKAVHKKDWQNSSLPNLRQNLYISCPDAVAMMGNIAKHLKYISSSVIYIRTQIQSRPRIMELAQDSANVHNLLDEVEDSLKNIRILYDEVRFFKMHLDKIQDNNQYIPADLIVEVIPSNTPQRRILYAAIGISTAIIAVGIIWKYPNSLLNRVQSLLQLKSFSSTQ